MTGMCLTTHFRVVQIILALGLTDRMIITRGDND